MRRALGFLLLGAGATLCAVRCGRPADSTVSAMRLDLDGDGRQDTVEIRGVRAREGGEVGQLSVVVRASGRETTFGPYEAAGPDDSPWRLPAEVASLQLLPEAPLASVDANLDGTPEAMARLRLPRSRANRLTLLLGVDRDKGEVVRLWQGEDDGVLLTDVDGKGHPALIPWVLASPDCPVLGEMWVWRDGAFGRSDRGLPRRLAEPLARYYRPRLPFFELQGAGTGPVLLEAYARAGVASGEAMEASSQVDMALGALEQAERDARTARRRVLMVQGEVRAASGAGQDALASFTQAYTLRPEEGFDCADGFAAYHVARCRRDAGGPSKRQRNDSGDATTHGRAARATTAVRAGSARSQERHGTG